ncbi:hypothetical protein Pmar_PMAR007525 [Perkinsus marinus ATCC 50983]|uniref:Uncharacterized protein n=1 Tax=Perkinsus marinus (strain ATCC 50983 / TXsc) TaxID=423536 RepID=C5LAW2_PERM5|nr:hypothetical protein Pmar_PMAR007525 [Perkinsus marinus ATCC 50983]EER06131.1 hypothetical protein Pmar_PMAR007525 [Perkinsus marinus ATCC 50983]|eukprot:XP_002774315.1 hypothetical protein Pmar_PMAR007525 [Perkinsus marinus ATCC 50983]
MSIPANRTIINQFDPPEVSGTEIGTSSSQAGGSFGGNISTIELTAIIGGLIILFMLVCAIGCLARLCRQWANARVVAKPAADDLEDGDETLEEGLEERS